VLPAIAGAVGSETFTLHELKALESAALRVVFERVNKERLGKLLARASKAQHSSMDTRSKTSGRRATRGSGARLP
jgi:hypothetical protein